MEHPTERNSTVVKPIVWTGLAAQLHNALTEQIEVLEELLAAGEGSLSDADRLEYRQQLRNARHDLRDLEERYDGNGRVR